VAISSHAEAHGTYPTSQRPESAYWRLLPYFERTDLLEAIHRFQSPGGDAPGSWHVESFGCPDDSVVWEQMVAGSTNYYYNCGTRFLTRTPYNGFQKSTQQDTRPSDISDGLSQTVAMSERLVRRLTLPWPPPEVFEREPRRSSWWTEVRYGGAGEEALAIDQCRNHRTTTFPPIGGKSAFNLQSGNGYDHLLPPNHPACNNGPEDFGFDGELMLIPSSSNHSGGAFSLLADGSVHFVSELVDPEVWQALGTRNGQEGVALPF
jgi:hypothetical protein